MMLKQSTVHTLRDQHKRQRYRNRCNRVNIGEPADECGRQDYNSDPADNPQNLTLGLAFHSEQSNVPAQARRADRNRIEQKRSTGVALQRACSPNLRAKATMPTLR